MITYHVTPPCFFHPHVFHASLTKVYLLEVLVLVRKWRVVPRVDFVKSEYNGTDVSDFCVFFMFFFKSIFLLNVMNDMISNQYMSKKRFGKVMIYKVQRCLFFVCDKVKKVESYILFWVLLQNLRR